MDVAAHGAKPQSQLIGCRDAATALFVLKCLACGVARSRQSVCPIVS